MFDQATIDKMTTMRLSAMADAFREQAESAQYRDLTFEERFGLLVDAEWTSRQQRKLSRRLKSAQLRYPASIEDVDFQAPRGLSKQAVLSLASCNWIEAKQNVVVTGATGTSSRFRRRCSSRLRSSAGMFATTARLPSLPVPVSAPT